ncbi:MAG: LysR family transcriptional regulator [Alphaproteobacteria bacterium]
MAGQLDFKHLEALAAVVDAGGVSRAAHALGLSQSALSHRIAEAERRLGLALFDRVGQRLRPTPAGERMLAMARDVLARSDEGEREARVIAAEGRPPVQVTSGPFDRWGWFARFATVAGFPLQVAATGETPAQRALQSGQADVAIECGVAPDGPLRVWPLFNDAIVLLARPDHPLAAAAAVRPADLSDAVTLTYSVVPVPGHSRELFSRPAGVHPGGLRKAGPVSAILAMVEAGHGVTLLSRWLAADHVAAGRLVARSLEPAVPLAWFALTRPADGPQSAAGQVAERLALWSRNHDWGEDGAVPDTAPRLVGTADGDGL